jgi:hypothetical protein
MQVLSEMEMVTEHTPSISRGTELLNEQSNVPQAYADAVTSYVRANDPYRHLITINYAQAYHAEFDLETFHAYWPNAEVSMAAEVAGSINNLTS